MSHPIENILKTTMQELREMVDVNTIIGDPVIMGNGTVIIPVSKVCLGFLSGGGEYGMCTHRDGEDEPPRHPFAGTSVAGVNLTPMAFLAITGDVVQVLPAHYNTTLDRVIEMVPEAVRQAQRVIKDLRNGRPEEDEAGQYTEEEE